MTKDLNPTEYQSSDENIPDHILEKAWRAMKHYINDTIVWDINKYPWSDSQLDYTFMSYDSEGKSRRYLTHSAHQSRPYSLEDGDSIDIGYVDIQDYLDNK